MQDYAEQAIQAQMESVIQPQMDAQFNATKTLFVDADRQERERIMRHASVIRTVTARCKRQAWTKRPSWRASTNPVRCEVFTYKGERDTVITPRDSILHHKRIMRASIVSMDPARLREGLRGRS